MSLYTAYLEARAILARSDTIYPLFIDAVSLLRPHQRDLLVRRSSELVVGGFPRSANTYFVSAFELAQGRPVRLARHLHESYPIRFAERHGIPCVVLIRAPLDSVVSALLLDPRMRPRPLLRNYLRLYSEVLKVRKNAVIAPFDIVTGDVNAVIRKLNERYRTNFRTLQQGSGHLVQAEIAKKDMRALGGTTLDPVRIAAPSPEKSRAKPELSTVSGAKPAACCPPLKRSMRKSCH